MFRKNVFKESSVFLEGFPPGGAATHRRMLCLEFFGMFRLFWECLNCFWHVMFFGIIDLSSLIN